MIYGEKGSVGETYANKNGFYSREQWAKQPRSRGYLANAARVSALRVQIPRPLGRKEQARPCPVACGIAADEKYLMVSEYGENGSDAEIVIFQRWN